MKVLSLLVLVVSVSACGSSPTAPTVVPPPPPLPAAQVASFGNLTVTACTPSGVLFSCFAYSGAAQNSGQGCAANVRGVTTAFDAATKIQTGTSGWSYGQMIRPTEQIVYDGISLIVSGPLSGGWVYTTTITWDNVKCP